MFIFFYTIIVNYNSQIKVISILSKYLCIKMNDKIEAFFEDDLVKILKKLNLLDPVKNGEIKCSFCEEIITQDTIGCIFPRDNKIFFCCDKIKCIQKAIEMQSIIRNISKKED